MQPTSDFNAHKTPIFDNVVVHRVVNVTESWTFPYLATYELQHAFPPQLPIEIQTQEAWIILAIEALQICKSLNRRSAPILYKVPYSTLTDRMAGWPSRYETKANSLKLTELEEEVIIRNILDIDARGFAPQPASIEDIANYILKSHRGKCIGI